MARTYIVIINKPGYMGARREDYVELHVDQHPTQNSDVEHRQATMIINVLCGTDSTRQHKESEDKSCVLLVKGHAAWKKKKG